VKTDWRGRRVLVTGGAGFLGSGLSLALAQQGASVVALDAFLRDSGANGLNLSGSGVEVVVGDLRTADLSPICRRVDVLFNLAAQVSHMDAEAEPASDLEINGAAQLRLIESLRKHAPDAIVVHASTRQFYGRPQRLPVNESHPINPQDMNGVSKFAGEQYWMVEGRTRSRPVTSLRLTNCYGPRLRIKDDRQCFIGVWVRRLLENQPFEVWDGTQIRDLLYLDDAVAAFLLAAHTPACMGNVFNVGGAEPVTMLNLAELLVAANGGAGRFVTKPFPEDRAKIDIGSYCTDDAAFRAATGWVPRMPLPEGLKETLSWFRSRLADYL
jgi:nucleoside-diphosphate-sugar epimerase